jgi:hypothetical protein
MQPAGSKRERLQVRIFPQWAKRILRIGFAANLHPPVIFGTAVQSQIAALAPFYSGHLGMTKKAQAHARVHYYA